MPKTKIGQFRVVAKIEGISFIILLFIAMPLKYMMGIPEATKIIGMIHGGLFIWYIYAQFIASQEEKWGSKFNALAFALSLVPFGTFYLVKNLQEKENR
jgi:integral membrane protein